MNNFKMITLNLTKQELNQIDLMLKNYCKALHSTEISVELPDDVYLMLASLIAKVNEAQIKTKCGAV